MSDVIRTERLVLRPLDAKDASVMVEGFNDYQVVRWLEAPPQPFTKSDFKPRNNDGSSRWPETAVIEHQGKMIGTMSSVPHFGYWLLRAAWGQGFATEAGRAMVTRAFEELQADHLESGYFEGNQASANVLTKLGFSEMGQEMRWCNPRGKDVAFTLMRLERADWEARV